jgi:hypothetical protein
LLQQLLGFIAFGCSQLPMNRFNAQPGNAHHAMPPDIANIVAQARWRTQKQADLALMHAVQLDRQLRQLGYSEPVTYAQHGVVTSQTNTDDQAPDWRQNPPGTLACLHQAQRSAWQTDDTLAQAYAQARGPEIPALNLLYANSATDIDSLWLHFFNKYLAHHSPGNAKDNQLSLSHGPGSRFDRLQPATRPAHTPDSTHGPRVSVIMPVFNASATLRKAAQSILNQTWRHLELILVDDQSQDDSLALAHQLRAQDDRVKVLALPINGGPYEAKNQALAHATGQYLTVHDADDWAFPTRIAQQMQPLLQAGPSGVAVTMGRTLRCDMHGQFTRFQPIDWVSIDGALRLCFPSPLFDRAYFDQKLGAWDKVRVGADHEIFQRIKRFEPDKLHILDIPVMLQLDTENSLTRHPDTYNDERGEAPARAAYRQAWSAWHASHTAMPKTLRS